MDVEHALPEGEHLANLVRRIDRPIVLVGMMGVGKTSLGRKLAALLGVAFIDADEAIEEAAQMTIPEIFAAHGEAYFRDGERRVIARLLGESDSLAGATPALRQPSQPAARTAGLKIISTGGGAFCHPQTRDLILKRGIAVWLDADLDTLVERTSRKDNRPLLRGGNPRDILARLKAERRPHYAQAPIHIMSGNGPHSRAMARVLAEIEKWLVTAEPLPKTAPAAPSPAAPIQES